MSRMTKFLKQTCRIETARRNADGTTKLSEYGDVLYGAPHAAKCRREKYVRAIQTNNGAILTASTRYFLDETAPVDADDRIDGRVVLTAEEYINQFGVCEGYEVYVV